MSVGPDALIDASGQIAAVGGSARAEYVNPVDITALMTSKEFQDRPRLGPDYVGGPSGTVSRAAGDRIRRARAVGHADSLPIYLSRLPMRERMRLPTVAA